jgi:LPXTG-motif cell wall-anchored protein
MRQRPRHARRTAAGLASIVAGAVILVGAFPADAGIAGGDYPDKTTSTHEDTTSTEEETTSTTEEETTSTTKEETTTTTEEETTTTAAEETTTTVADEATTTTTAPAGELPKTGSSTGLMVALGAALLAGGGALLATTRVLRRS